MEIGDIQKAIQENVAKLEEEHKEKAEKLAKERADLQRIAEEENAKKLKAKLEAEEKANKRKQAEQEAEQERTRKERESQLLLDMQNNEATERLRIQAEKMKELETELAQAQFMEEQNKKALESLQNYSDDLILSDTKTHVTKTGDPVEGIHGNTPETPLMSEHLKHILRQENRTY